MKQNLQTAILRWHARKGRASLPWRATTDPYAVLVSEFMLQQTQVNRVIPIHGAFLRAFPNWRALAVATLAEVVRAWRGLGYNSRAVRLKRLAEAVVRDHGGELPRSEGALRALPGIGAYTAAAVRAFAFNEHCAAVDTNIRRVVHRIARGIEHPPKMNIKELHARADALVPERQAREWNAALMDLGALHCTALAPKCTPCPALRWCAAGPVDGDHLARARRRYATKKTPQESMPFAQTTRFARGRIVDRLRDVPRGEMISFLILHRELKLPYHGEAAIGDALGALERDGIVRRDGQSFALVD
ncbi:MAG: A/G-specific adenine glycosylase [Candidatus Meridianibacter frigidus]|nr:MAG: A/G-specific adenine glycosylase [Candidatus Eremiobacteraeota bacterium]